MIAGNIAENMYKSSQNVLDGCCCLLSNVFPETLLDLKFFGSFTQTLEITSPEIDGVGCDIFEQEVEPFQGFGLSIVKRLNMGHHRQIFDSCLLCNLFFCGLCCSFVNLSSNLDKVIVPPKWTGVCIPLLCISKILWESDRNIICFACPMDSLYFTGAIVIDPIVTLDIEELLNSNDVSKLE